MAYLEEWEKPMQNGKEEKIEAKREKEKWWTAHPPTILTASLRTKGLRESESKSR